MKQVKCARCECKEFYKKTTGTNVLTVNVNTNNDIVKDVIDKISKENIDKYYCKECDVSYSEDEMTSMAEELILKKEIRNAGNNKEAYLLGVDKDGIKHWLESPSWDCDWYWGMGYVETRTSHQHFDGLIIHNREANTINEHFHDTPFTDKEAWELTDLMASAYSYKKIAEICHTGGSHYTTVKDFSLKDEAREKAINEIILPSIFTRIKKILTTGEQDENNRNY